MKKSNAIKKLHFILNNYFQLDLKTSEEIMKRIEKEIKLAPPRISIKKIYPNETEFGSMCSIGCNCESCNPNFIVNKWEPETK